MPKNDEGEFELVLGNRQLISVFLIVVILLGVFFSMGYIVGRNSSPGAAESARNESPKPDQTADSSSATPPSAAPSDATTPSATNSSAAPPADSTPPESTKPAQSAPPPAPAPAKEIKSKPSPSPPPERPVEHAADAGREPASGDYWQVVATARPDAEIIAEALGKKGFHVVLAPAPKGNIFRVLVGPLPDAPTQAQTRTSLESAGFKNPIMRKY